MSANTERHAIVEDSFDECAKLLDLFEAGEIELSPGFTVVFTAQQIIDLKQAYASARSAGIAAWQAVSAS